MDPRQQRSRERLYEAILSLANEQSVAELSVTEVARTAAVHRSTFYQHASSPAALLEDALRDELDELRTGLDAVRPGTPVDATVTAVTEAVVRHVKHHLPIYRRGLGAGSGEASLHAMLSAHFRESGLRLLRQPGLHLSLEVPGVADAALADAATRFIADGTVGLLEGWVQQPSPDVGGFMGLYAALLPRWWPGATAGDA